MTKMKYLMPDVDKHTAGILYIAMIVFICIVGVIANVYHAG